jgi:hypothetical protein
MARYKFQCQLCYEDKGEPRSQVRIIDGCEVCSTCLADEVAPHFAAALHSELDYPVKWGQTILEIDDFRALVPAAVLEAWPARVREYETPVYNRVYCSHLTLGPIDRAGRRRLEVCGNFLGSTKTSDQFQCPKCKTWSKDHHLHCPCTGGAGNQQANAAQPTLDKRTRGAEWQKCPNSTCGVVVERSTGCNHFECTFCQMSFCYICGNFADADSDHWLNVCPRYGQPGDKDASFDEEYEFDSDEDEDEEDWVDESHHISHDLDSDVVQSDTLFFGRLLTEPGPNPSSLNQLDYDSEIATLLQYDFHAETEFVFGSLEDAPRNVRIFFELLQAFEENLNWACLQLTGGRPTTTVDAVDEAVLFSNFRIRHDRLRRNMLATREEALSWFEHYSVMITNIPARAFIDVFERYCILHAPRYIWNAQAHHRAPGRHQKIRYDVGSIFESKRRERRDDGSEDELLLHTRRVDSEDTYVYA